MTVRLENEISVGATSGRGFIGLRWLPVLMYHRVVEHTDAPDPYHLCIPKAEFEAQMAYLSTRGYEAIRLEGVPNVFAGHSHWKKPVAITFDDGYRDTYTLALPILQKYGFSATVMLVSGHIGGRNSWDSGKTAPAPLLTLEEIRELAQHGIRFGAHGATHAALPDLPLDDVRQELLGCKTKLEQQLGETIATLAYPYGRSTPEIARIAEEVGFTAAFGVDHGCRQLFNYSRIDAAACRGDSLVWRLKVTGIYYTLRESRGLRTLNRLRKRVLHETTA